MNELEPTPNLLQTGISKIEKGIRWVLITAMFLIGSTIGVTCFLGIGCIRIFNNLRQRS